MADEPPTVNENDIVEATFKGTLCGQTILNVWHYRLDGSGAPALDTALDDLRDQIDSPTGLKGKWLAAAAGNYQLDQLVLQVISPVRWARFAYDIGEPGAQANDASTADLACYTELSGWFATDRTLGGKRGMTGGYHFAPVPAEFIVDGMVDPDYRDPYMTDIGAKILLPLAAAGGGNWQPTIYHRNGEGVKYTDVTRYKVKPEARVMRRRTVGRGI